MTEEWRRIEGFSPYSVSNLGQVRNDETGHLLKPFRRGYENHYLGVDLYRGSVRKPRLVHRLVATAFISKPTDRLANEVNHFDCDTTNNHATNLEWVTRQENEMHKRFMEAWA